MVVLIGEVDEFTVDELFVADDLTIVDHDCLGVIACQPLLALVCILLGKD